MKRLTDLLYSAVALIALSPLLVLTGLAVWLEDRGPVLYRAVRAGQGGRPFTILKFRTMQVARKGSASSRVTAAGDARITRVGSVLRAAKIDELPQLVNILKGDMSVVGPRPEDMALVLEHYTDGQWETLAVRPGLASPGSLYNYTHAEKLVPASDPERTYLKEVLPVKLGLERVYVHRSSMRLDLKIILTTIGCIVMRLAGRTEFPDPPELEEALAKYVEPVRNVPN